MEGITGTHADNALGVSFGTTLQPEERFTTIELKINFLKPVWSGTIRADAKVMKKGQPMESLNVVYIGPTGEPERSPHISQEFGGGRFLSSC